MSTLTIPSDAERLVSQFLRQDPDVAAVLGDRVYTIMPQHPEWPLARLTLWGGAPVVERPLVLQNARIQIDVWGDRKKQAHDAAQLVRAVLVDRLPWGNSTDGWLVRSLASGLRYFPDDSFDPARPRYVVEMEVFVRTA